MEDSRMVISCQDDKKEVELVVDEEPENRLPGFRFHPTDEELVSFYRNSVRPNRVTGSGFWKATGIDKPIYSEGGEAHRCVGLKKSLVYYRGIAGKGSKTDWMMHEFRLPTEQQHSSPPNPRDTLQQAEVWTLCRILRKSRKYTPDWRELPAKRSATPTTTTSNTCSAESISNRECYISFDTKNMMGLTSNILGPPMAHTSATDSSPLNPSSSVEDQLGDHFTAAYDGNWDDLSSVVEFAIRAPLL